MSLVAQRINELQTDAQVAIVVISDSATGNWLVKFGNITLRTCRPTERKVADDYALMVRGQLQPAYVAVADKVKGWCVDQGRSVSASLGGQDQSVADRVVNVIETTV